MKHGLLALAVSFLCCSQPVSASAGSNIGNIDLAEGSCCGVLSLPDSNGVRRQLNDFAGQVVVVTFGFTGCPDICPTTLAELAKVLESLEEKKNDVQVLFVTLDPERDTNDILSRYVSAFHPSFIALRGSNEETVRTAKDFRVLYRKVPDQKTTNYSIDHTIGVYLFDRAGKPQVYAQSVRSENLLPEIERLLAVRNP